MNATNCDGTTPLHDAVKRQDVSIVQELMVYGADPTICAIKGCVPVNCLFAQKSTMIDMHFNIDNRLTKTYDIPV